ncbi:3-keto-5-aminohexanoate cleavage enzyme [Shimia sp. SK013]|nr:3-keto-5-aminohexanoate cleavage enzyme [Shimia sp. SK013]
MSAGYDSSEILTDRRLTAITAQKMPRITVAPNGARRQKADHPAIPLTISEITKTARACQIAGAGALHLHVRDAANQHTLDAGLYRETIAEIESHAPGMAIQTTTEAGGIFDVPAQLTCLLDLRPTAASVSVREIMRSPDLAPHFYATAADIGTEVQHILYDTDDLNTLCHLIDTGTIPQDMRDVLLVLGRYIPPRPARASELAPFVAALKGEFPNWTVCAFGANEHAVMLQAAKMGGDLRIGFENNICRPDGTPAADNAENIARIATALREPSRKEPTP